MDMGNRGPKLGEDKESNTSLNILFLKTRSLIFREFVTKGPLRDYFSSKSISSIQANLTWEWLQRRRQLMKLSLSVGATLP